MKKFIIQLLLITLTANTLCAAELKLWYARPAEKWTDALPIGSGRLGAMVFGGTANERIQYNEDTLWTGKPHDYVHRGAADHLGEIRKAVTEGNQKEAEDLIREHFLSIPLRQRAYQPFGDLNFTFAGHEAATDYRRELDIDAAVARTSYVVNGVRYTREAFASYPDNVIVIRISADKPGTVSFSLTHTSPHKVSQVHPVGDDTLVLSGQVQDPKRFMYSQIGAKPPQGYKPEDEPVQTDGLKFESCVRVMLQGGKSSAAGNRIEVVDADSAVVLLVAATSFQNFRDISGDPAAKCRANLTAIRGKSFKQLLATHTQDHQALFRRVTINLGETDKSKLPTDERLARLKKEGIEADPALAALHFQYGRYLLIASSRPGTQAANLQGVWNELLDPPWESKYTTNINVEMNYWPAEVTNLSECHEPLFDLTRDCAVSGAKVAKEHYGASGWVLHHNTDIWRGAAPINNIDGQWPTGAAWLCYHLWEHYLFTGDREFLSRRAFPVMLEACRFFVDFLVKDPRTGWLISTPSHSPEQGGAVAGPAMDHQLIRALFDSTIEAAAILHSDVEAVAQVKSARAQLAPDQIGQHGQLQEWLTDIDVPNNNHRHMSPLWCLYPGAQYTPMDADPKLFEAARVLLQWRGDGSTGWSFAWRMPLWARALDGDMALKQYNGLLDKRTLPNLFDLCGPFQIDGNFGATAGVAEMLLQSHARTAGASLVHVIHLLPALPRAWPNGSVTGLCARGGFEVDLSWAEGKLTRAVVRSKRGNACKLKIGNQITDLQTDAGKTYTFSGDGEREARAASGTGAIVSEEFIYDNAPYPSCHASTLAPTRDGIIAAWFGGTRERAPDVGIWVARLVGGKWTVPVEVADGVQPDGSRLPCWNPVLFQPSNGPLMLFYKVGPKPSEWWGLLRTSSDSGKTWSEPTRLRDGILGPVKNKPVELSDGSLLCPSSSENGGWKLHFERTADLGKTWTSVSPKSSTPPIDAIQPSVLVHPEGRLQAIGRTRSGKIFETWSNDGGASWSALNLLNLPNPNSGTDAVTLRDCRQLLVYNHNAMPKGRTPLNVALSNDGRTWKAALALESGPGEYSYPAVIQTQDGKVHVTYTWQRRRIKHVVIDPTKLEPCEMPGGDWPAGFSG